MGCIGLLLAILGIFGYANQIWWLFYLAGGIAAVFDILALISGELRCLGTIITVGFWVSAYRQTGSLVDGLSQRARVLSMPRPSFSTWLSSTASSILSRILRVPLIIYLWDLLQWIASTTS